MTHNAPDLQTRIGMSERKDCTVVSPLITCGSIGASIEADITHPTINRRDSNISVVSTVELVYVTLSSQLPAGR